MKKTILKYFLLICIPLLITLSGCVIMTKTQPTSPKMKDTLIERNRQWREHIQAGNIAFQEGHLQDALKSYQTAITFRPKNSETQYKIAETYFKLEEYEKARDAFIVFLSSEPNHISALNHIGYIYERLRSYENAAKYFKKVLKTAENDLYALNHLAAAYKQLNRHDEAEALLRKALKIDPECEHPDNRNLHNYLGLIHLQRGEVGNAIAEFRNTIRLFPNDIWTRQQLASIYEDHKRYFEAQLQYRELLDVDPQNLLAKTRLQALAHLSPAPSQIAAIPPITILKPDVRQIIADAPNKNDYPDADVVILFNHFSHDVSPTGQSRYTTHQVVKILTERGIQKYGDIAIPYQPTSQNIGVNIARTFGIDGTVHLPPEEAFNDVTPPGLLSRNLYSDLMWHVISMVGLTPGVCIEYQVTLEDKIETTAGSETWITGGFNFQNSEVTLQTTYALRMPQDWNLKWKVERTDLEPEIDYDENGIVQYIWQSGEMPALEIEDAMPHINDIAPRLSYSSIKSWHNVYNWYKNLAKDRYTPDEHMQETVEKLTQNLKTHEEIIRTIYYYVAKQIRYVGIELGQSAYQPSPATEVLQKQYGDCKDKTTLLIAMLDLVGIKSYPVMLSTSPYQKIDKSLPSLSQFNHMIAAVPKDNTEYLWLDPTASTCTNGNLPYTDQGRTGLLIGDTQGKFVDIPVFPAESNTYKSTTELQIDKTGDAKGKIRIKMTGQYNIDARWMYEQTPPIQWNDNLAYQLSERFPHIKVDSVSISDLDNLQKPIEISVQFHVKNYVKRIKDHLMLLLPIDEFSDYAKFVAASERTYPLDMNYPMKIEKVILIHLPKEWRAVLPTDIKQDSSFARMERQYRQNENLVNYHLVFKLKQRIITVKDYAKAKQFFNNLAREDGSHLLLNENKVSNRPSTHR